MERLTIPDVRVDDHTTYRTMIDVEAVREHAMDFYWRLKAYEDTELTPEEIDMDHEAAEQLRRLCRDCDLGRLEELVKADKEGHVVALPCKVGDMVYVSYGEGYRSCAVDRIHVLVNNEVQIRMRHFITETLWLSASDFGKTVFLTSEEAEAALEAMKDE